MTSPIPMVEIWRGPLLESLHSGHAVICDAKGNIRRSWGNPQATIYPRSSAKMIQALPLVTSGAAAKFGLGSEQLALACASHNGAEMHTRRVNDWIKQLGLSDQDLRCGTQLPNDIPARNALIKTDRAPCQAHNNCSGKHAGFLTLTKHLGATPEYIDPDHPVQKAALDAFEYVTDETSPGFGIDGCSAPNFVTSLHGLARAMAWFASAHQRTDTTSRAANSLVNAMITHPELVAGEPRACTNLMRAMRGKAAVKTGAEAVFVAIIPEQKLGVALKITDGATRASECAITALLVSLGLLHRSDPVVAQYMNAPLLNRRKINCGSIRPTQTLLF
ncbi:asparaginase [Epibacterium ulvae]|uniref:Asparaginase n=1 Tax=Epibacterium ulvae TaxID=1156985 RepID=A0A1G5R7Y8_9RHOB|nr:asparaginase [Epibacterium ulvae]SCZ70193.1 asparaginase [Epibacterium ulvae]